MPNYGVIDLGSNSIRLVVYETKNEGGKAYGSDDFKSLISDKVMAGLSAFVEDGAFTAAGVDRAASVLKGHMRRARYFKCARLDVFATAVLRNCTNSHDAVEAVSKRIGVPITLLSSQDEAHLGFVGATCAAPIDRGTLIDIGGGSTEITRIRKGVESNNESIGVGSLSSFARHVKNIMPSPTEMEAISDALWERFCEQVPDPRVYASPRFYGIGGSVRAAAKMLAQMNGSPERPQTLSLTDIEAIVDFLCSDPAEFAHLALKASSERVHTMVPGVLIMRRLMRELGGQEIEIRKHGVREGYLIERMLSPKASTKKEKVAS